MKRIGNNKLLIDDKELQRLVKECFDRGAVFGCKANAVTVISVLKEMNESNFEIIRDQIMGFCTKTIEIADSNKKKGDENVGANDNN